MALDVISAPASLDIAFLVVRSGALTTAPPTVMVNEYVGADVLARAADGRLVAGAGTAWTTSAPVDTLTRGLTELVFEAPKGTLAVVATSGALTASRQLTAQ